MRSCTAGKLKRFEIAYPSNTSGGASLICKISLWKSSRVILNDDNHVAN